MSLIQRCPYFRGDLTYTVLGFGYSSEMSAIPSGVPAHGRPYLYGTHGSLYVLVCVSLELRKLAVVYDVCGFT